MSKYFIFCCIIIQYILVANCKQFGYLSLFTCHCTYDNECNADGSCRFNGCATGWSGSTCQKQNVALRKPAYQGARYNPSKYGPELAVDGDKSRPFGRTRQIEKCMDTGSSNNRWWSVNLTDTYPIRQIYIFNRFDNDLKTLKGFNIDVIQDNGTTIQCYKQPDDKVPTSIDFTVSCNDTIWGSGINISSTITATPYNYLVLCEVEVNVCSNRTYGEECEKFCYCKDDVSCDYVTGECSTEGCLPGFTGPSCNQTCGQGSYGVNCSLDCNDRRCSGSQNYCYFDTGQCDNGCLPGYNGTDCTQVCTTGTYGNNCLQTCPTNCLNQECNYINGICIGGCKPGYRYELCDQKCSPTMYGINCSKSCDERNCYGSDYTECNHITGNCTEGCKPGFSDVDCSKLCAEGLYGKDCSNMCTDRNCLQNQNCDKMNGICINGCKPGFISIDCTQVCDEGYYGVNCSKKCLDRYCIKNSAVCKNVDGNCVGGCIGGYSGVDCFNAKPEDNETSIIIGVLVGIIILLVAIIVGVCIYLRKRTSSRSPTIKDPPVVYDVITSSNNSNEATPEAQIYMIDTEENDLPEQSNVNHYNSLRAAYINENPYEQITK